MLLLSNGQHSSFSKLRVSTRVCTRFVPPVSPIGKKRGTCAVGTEQLQRNVIFHYSVYFAMTKLYASNKMVE